MSAITITQLYQLLSKKIGAETAEALTSYVQEYVAEKVETNVEAKSIATKEDIAQLKQDIAQTKVDLIKWVVGLFITLAFMLLGLYLKE